MNLPRAKELQARLDEVNFVYRSLPAALERAEVVSPAKSWRTFFHRQAATLRQHQENLRAIVTEWGERLRPCVCDEVTERLNEVRHTLAARPETPVLERSVLGVLRDLRALVMKDLESAIRMATDLREDDLCSKLVALLNEERQQDRMSIALVEAGK